MGTHSDRWLKTSGRRMRFYVARDLNLRYAIKPKFVTGVPVQNAQAKDWSSRRTTWLETPLTFWKTLEAEQKADTPSPDYFPKGLDDEKLHQLVPLAMLTHALTHSGLE